MEKRHIVLHIFRRDLRIIDNNSINDALNKGKTVLPLFIIDPVQVELHRYRSENGLIFMFNSLKELDDDIKREGGQLYVGYGNPVDVIKDLVRNVNINEIQVNRDYTPFSEKRDQAIQDFCNSNAIGFTRYNDLLLTEPEQVHKSDGNPYSVYTYFARKAREITPLQVEKNSKYNFINKKIKGFNSSEKLSKIGFHSNNMIRVKGGRKEGLQLLNRLNRLKEYEIDRDIPAKDATTLLSAHNKFGTISIRELYWKIVEELGEEHGLISQLYWRDFFTHIAWHFPHVFQGAFYQKYDKIEWDNNEKEFHSWCNGETGFPIIDAGMRELNATGYMHNRVRMIVASFLVKDLHINWQWGEQYFARHLVDYDPSINNGNWQWAASTGCDAQPYFRIFNPWRQQKRFDPECKYIKLWVPEIKDIPIKIIHNPLLIKEIQTYPNPICDHKSRAELAKKMFKENAKK